jgi:hypothetical protein
MYITDSASQLGHNCHNANPGEVMMRRFVVTFAASTVLVASAPNSLDGAIVRHRVRFPIGGMQWG